MRTGLALIVALLVAGPAYAQGWLSDSIIRPLQTDISRSLDKANRDVGKAVEKAVQDTGRTVEKATGKPIDAKALTRDLTAKTDDDLLLLTLSADPCSEIDCHGVPSDIAQRAVKLSREKKQIIVDLEVRKSQAWAAVISAAISSLSLLISIASFIRAGRRAPTP